MTKRARPMIDPGTNPGGLYVRHYIGAGELVCEHPIGGSDTWPTEDRANWSGLLCREAQDRTRRELTSFFYDGDSGDCVKVVSVSPDGNVVEASLPGYGGWPHLGADLN